MPLRTSNGTDDKVAYLVVHVLEEGEHVRPVLELRVDADVLQLCESDEHSAIADLISAGLGIGLVPDLAGRSATRAPAAWIDVDDPDCSRTVTLYWGADSHRSAAAQLMRTTITGWTWLPDSANRD